MDVPGLRSDLNDDDIDIDWDDENDPEEDPNGDFDALNDVLLDRENDNRENEWPRDEALLCALDSVNGTSNTVPFNQLDPPERYSTASPLRISFGWVHMKARR